MVSLTVLWLPIVLSAVCVFLASAIIHMVLGYHKTDYGKLPGESNIADAMRQEGVKPGSYALPHCANPKDMGSPEMVAKYQQGPNGLLTILPNGVPSMGKLLGQWFVYCLGMGVFVAYVTGRCLGPGTEYMEVFRMASTAAFLGYVGAEPIASIWKGQPWSVTLKHMFDGTIYCLLVGGVFGSMWPS